MTTSLNGGSASVETIPVRAPISQASASRMSGSIASAFSRRAASLRLDRLDAHEIQISSTFSIKTLFLKISASFLSNWCRRWP